MCSFELCSVTKIYVVIKFIAINHKKIITCFSKFIPQSTLLKNILFQQFDQFTQGKHKEINNNFFFLTNKLLYIYIYNVGYYIFLVTKLQVYLLIGKITIVVMLIFTEVSYSTK